MKWGTLATVVVIAVLGGVLAITMRTNKTAAPVPETAMQVTATPASTNAPTGTVPADTSDAALDSDASEISTQLSALNQDSADIDVSLHDTMGNMSEN
jgi:hypothetical protein